LCALGLCALGLCALGLCALGLCFRSRFCCNGLLSFLGFWPRSRFRSVVWFWSSSVQPFSFLWAFVPRCGPVCLTLGLLCLASGLCAFLRLLFGSSSDFLRASSSSSACVLFWCPDFCLMPLVLLYGNVAPSSSFSISIMFLFYFSTSLTLKILFGTYRAWLLNACFHHRGITIGSFQYSTDGLFAAATLLISMLHCIVQIMYIHTC